MHSTLKSCYSVCQCRICLFDCVVSDFPQECCPVVLAPLLYPEKRDILMDRILPDSGELAKTMMESSLSEFMQEVGYGFCARWIHYQHLLNCTHNQPSNYIFKITWAFHILQWFLSYLKWCCSIWLIINMLAFVSSVDECRNIILQYGVREVTASQVARVLGMMARTHSGLTDGIPLQVRCLFVWRALGC